MIIRTTKQKGYQIHVYSKGYYQKSSCDKPDHVFVAKTKREVVGLMKTIMDNFDPDHVDVMNQESFLCKSPEQKVISPKDESLNKGSTSVSGEHSDLGNGSTGEEITVLPKTTSSCGKSGSVLSSPVQNPEEQDIKDLRVLINRYPWNAGKILKEFDEDIQKKCTCSVEDRKQRTIKADAVFCAYCGGEL